MNSGEFKFDGSASAPLTLVLAHGARAPMDSPFMEEIVRGLAGTECRVVRFEFPYMRARREHGRPKAPDREPVLVDCWRAVVESLGGGQRLVIGGKSLGGRIASMIADECGVRGLICLGYPFHPPGRVSSDSRIRHLKSIETPTLIVQGSRDRFGGRAEVEKYVLSSRVQIAWIEGGDHSFRAHAGSGRTDQQNLAAVIEVVRLFLATLPH